LRASHSKQVFCIGSIGEFIVGEPISRQQANGEVEEDLTDQEEEEDLDSCEQDSYRRKGGILKESHRRSINAILAKIPKTGRIPGSEVIDLLKNHFGLRKIAIAQYGQKLKLTRELKAGIHELSNEFEVCAAIALQIGNEDQLWVSKIQRARDTKWFPFLLSSIAGNFQKNSSTSPSCYRVIGYNSLQHIKKKKKFILETYFQEASLKEALFKDLDSITSFVMNDLVDKIMQGTYFRL
jgi:hypothetical protein